MQQLITILHILVSICVVSLVLIQRGKGADMGAGFGSSASGTVFGSQGATPFLVKLTASLAILFFISSGVLSFVVGRQATQAVSALPFAVAPIKTEQPIPLASEVQQKAAEPVKSVTPAAKKESVTQSTKKKNPNNK